MSLNLPTCTYVVIICLVLDSECCHIENCINEPYIKSRVLVRLSTISKEMTRAVHAMHCASRIPHKKQLVEKNR